MRAASKLMLKHMLFCFNLLVFFVLNVCEAEHECNYKYEIVKADEILSQMEKMVNIDDNRNFENLGNLGS